MLASRHEPSGTDMRMTDLRVGWTVVGNDGRRVGTVKGVGQNYIVTSRPGFAADLFVPASFVGNVEDEVIHLTVTQPDTEQIGWEQEPRDGDVPEGGADSDLHRHI